MKKLFQKVKSDIKFKSAGEGHKLTDAPSSSNNSTNVKPANVPIRQEPVFDSQAGIAALERLDKNKPTTSSRSKKYAKELARLGETHSPPQKTHSQEDILAKHIPVPEVYSVDGVKFISALNGEVYSQKDLNEHYRENWLLKLDTEEGLEASCNMIHTLNNDRSKVDVAVKTICKYIDNILANPSEEKYKKIRKSNKLFSERVVPLVGTEEFLGTAGFKLTSVTTDENEELYFKLPNDIDIENLEKAKNCLLTTQPLHSKLHRDRKIFKPTDVLTTLNLPTSFYNLTAEEVRREQGLLTEEVELSQQLRTKAMREKPKHTRKYNYALIRVRFPDGYILQGTFGVYEKFSELRSFVGNSLNEEWAPYLLKTSNGLTLDKDDETLLSLSLVPSVLLNLTWNSEVLAQLHELGIALSIKKEILQKTQNLS